MYQGVEILNHPDIHKEVSNGVDIVFTEDMFTDDKWTIYRPKGGIVGFYEVEPNIHRIHIGFLKYFRGPYVKRVLELTFQDMFDNGATALIAPYPKGHKAVKALIKYFNFKSTGIKREVLQQQIEDFILTKDRWIK